MVNKSVKASGLYLLGNIFTKAIAFLTIPIFTRLLTTSEYGIVNTYTSWVNIASVVVELSLYNSFRKAFVEMDTDFEGYCASVIKLAGLLFLGSIVLGSIAILLIPDIRGIAWMLYCCLIQAFGVFCVTAMSSKYMMQFQYEKRALYMILPNALCAVVSVIVLMIMQNNRYVGRIVSYVIVYAVFILITLLSTKGKKINVKYWSYAIKYSVPLVFHGLSLVVLSSADRIMITSLVNASESGIYSLVHNLGLVATAITTSLEGIWIPWFVKKLKESKIDEINQKAVYFIENMTVVVIGVMLISPEILKLMSAEEYWSGIPMVIPIAIASYIMFLYDLAVNVEYQYGATKQIAFNTCIAAVINLIFNYYFIPIFGAIAAAYTTVAAYIFSMLLHYCIAKKYCERIFPIKKYAVYYLSMGVAAVLCSAMIDIAWARWLMALLLAVFYLYTMIKRKRFIALQITN